MRGLAYEVRLSDVLSAISRRRQYMVHNWGYNCWLYAPVTSTSTTTSILTTSKINIQTMSIRESVVGGLRTCFVD